jgi:hypothetical protein
MRHDDDADDATCVPFLVSQHVHGDVSEITSPHFQVEERTFLKPDAASLFSRISKGISDALSPATLVFDSPSTINAEDFLFDERSVNNCVLSFGGLTPGLQPQHAGHMGVSNNYNRTDSRKFIREANKNPRPTQIQRRAKDLRADSVPKCKSVSWVISPSTQSPVSSKISHPKAKNLDPSTYAGEDHWREVVDPESGRTYYYNPKTMKTQWRLPKGAIIKKASCQSHHQKYDPNITTDQIQLDKPLTPLKNHWRDTIGVTKLCISHSLDEGQSKSSQQIATHEPTLLRKERQPKVQQQPVSRKQNRPQEESKPSESSEKSQQSSSSQQTHNFCETVNDIAGVTKTPYSQFPQDCTSDAVFCLYCGLKCESAATFGSHHLPQCDKFAYMQRHGLSTQIEVESILFRAWSKIGSSTDNCSHEHASSHRQITASDVQRQIFSPRCNTFEEDGANLFGVATDKLRTLELDATSAVEGKTCPFCDEVFTYGNQFSSHLLKCEVRRRMRKQRRSTVARGQPSPPCKEYVTPGRRMPWE